MLSLKVSKKQTRCAGKPIQVQAQRGTNIKQL